MAAVESIHLSLNGYICAFQSNCNMLKLGMFNLWITLNGACGGAMYVLMLISHVKTIILALQSGITYANGIRFYGSSEMQMTVDPVSK